MPDDHLTTETSTLKRGLPGKKNVSYGKFDPPIKWPAEQLDGLPLGVVGPLKGLVTGSGSLLRRLSDGHQTSGRGGM